MSYIISKKIFFSYAHRMLNLKNKCSRIHGHNARVEIILESKTLKNGILVDFDKISEKIGNWINKNFDHRLIMNKNDPYVKKMKDLGEMIFLTDTDPSAEILAKLIYLKAKKFNLPVVKIRLWETEFQFAEYYE